MEDEREAKTFQIGNNLTVETYEAKTGPAIRIQEQSSFHEHRFARVLLDELDALVAWYKNTYPERQK